MIELLLLFSSVVLTVGARLGPDSIRTSGRHALRKLICQDPGWPASRHSD